MQEKDKAHANQHAAQQNHASPHFAARTGPESGGGPGALDRRTRRVGYRANPGAREELDRATDPANPAATDAAEVSCGLRIGRLQRTYRLMPYLLSNAARFGPGAAAAGA